MQTVLWHFPNSHHCLFHFFMLGCRIFCIQSVLSLQLSNRLPHSRKLPSLHLPNLSTVSNHWLFFLPFLSFLPFLPFLSLKLQLPLSCLSTVFFMLPSMPELSDMPNMPHMPNTKLYLSNMPNLSHMSNIKLHMPDVPNLSCMPDVSNNYFSHIINSKRSRHLPTANLKHKSNLGVNKDPTLNLQCRSSKSMHFTQHYLPNQSGHMSHWKANHLSTKRRMHWPKELCINWHQHMFATLQHLCQWQKCLSHRKDIMCHPIGHLPSQVNCSSQQYCMYCKYYQSNQHCSHQCLLWQLLFLTNSSPQPEFHIVYWMQKYHQNLFSLHW